jgi:hypothetical protein
MKKLLTCGLSWLAGSVFLSVAAAAEVRPNILFILADDLSAENPDKIKDLRARYDAYAKQAATPHNAPKPPGYTSPKVWGEKE